MIRLEVDDGISLIDLLEIEGGCDGCCGLVEVVSVRCQCRAEAIVVRVNLPHSLDLLLLTLLLRLTNEQMSTFCLAALHGHELVEF